MFVTLNAIEYNQVHNQLQRCWSAFLLNDIINFYTADMNSFEQTNSAMEWRQIFLSDMK